MKKYIVVMLFSFLMASCGQETEKIHLGENLRDKCHLVCMDSSPPLPYHQVKS